jgi:hypothetical protein
VDDQASGSGGPDTGAAPSPTSPAPGVPDPEALVPADVLANLAELPTDELRRLRASCEDAEEGVSYARRLLQGRLDLLRAELRHRDDDGAEGLLDALPSILSGDDAPGDPMKARATRLRVPPSADAHEAAIDAIVDEATLLDPAHLGIDDLRDVVARISAYEAELSVLRRALFDRIDALRDELAARYKDGRAEVGELLR